MDENDELIERFAAQLRPLPDVNPDAKARLLIAVATERERDRDAMVTKVARRRQLRWAGGGMLAAAALVTAVTLSSSPADVSSPAVAASGASPPPSAHLATASNDDLEMAPQPVQFVFRAPDAASVRIVGDFNGWSSRQSSMTRDSASGLWSATLLIRPGRHVYAFVVNDSVWARDPRAAAAPDADFGRPGSVLLVGRPADKVSP